MRLDQEPTGIKADDLRIGAGREPLADVGVRDRVAGLVDDDELIARDLRLAPERNVVRRRRRRQQDRLLLGLKVLEGAALRPTVSAQAIVLEAPVPGEDARIVERREHFAGKAVVTDTGYGPFDPAFVASMAHAGRIDVKMPSLGVLKKRGRDARREGIGVGDDRLGVLRNNDLEAAAETLPSRFARLDGARSRFLEGGIDEAMTGADRGKNPRAKPPPCAVQERQPADPARIDL